MKNKTNRRQFLKSGGCAAAAATLTSGITNPAFAKTIQEEQKDTSGDQEVAPEGESIAKSVEEKTFIPNRIAISTYSFWRYRDDSKFTIPNCIDMAAQMGFDAVEILRVQMEESSPSYLQQLKQRAFSNGLDLCGMSTHQGFVTPDADERKKNVAETIGFIEMAYALGIPTIRVNTGRWRTIKSFDELMANKGIEPILEGYTDDDGFQWVVDCLTECLPTAEKCGVVLGLENHWGLGRTADGVIRIIDEVNSPWLRATMDTGNFFERRKSQLQQMAPYTVFVQAKTYFGGGTWYDLTIDYDHVARILQEQNYRGYISLEFEGKEDYATAIPRSLRLLRDAFGKRQLTEE
ncbi:MAG: TIM barrel protein [Pirellulaceae bacterium]|nr:TIM barrel protein [Pirellulaceae bacterium]